MGEEAQVLMNDSVWRVAWVEGSKGGQRERMTGPAGSDSLEKRD